MRSGRGRQVQLCCVDRASRRCWRHGVPRSYVKGTGTGRDLGIARTLGDEPCDVTFTAGEERERVVTSSCGFSTPGADAERAKSALREAHLRRGAEALGGRARRLEYRRRRATVAGCESGTEVEPDSNGFQKRSC